MVPKFSLSFFSAVIPQHHVSAQKLICLQWKRSNQRHEMNLLLSNVFNFILSELVPPIWDCIFFFTIWRLTVIWKLSGNRFGPGGKYANLLWSILNVDQGTEAISGVEQNIHIHKIQWTGGEGIEYWNYKELKWSSQKMKWCKRKEWLENQWGV